MASKKRRKKATVTTTKRKKRRKKASPIHVAKPSRSELSLLHKINKKVTRIDHTVNHGFHLARKTKRAKRASDLDAAWAERDVGGYE